MKNNIAEPYVSALEEEKRVIDSWRTFQNFLECTEPQLLKKFREQANQIEAIILNEKNLYV
jgi:hypothetical protein